MRSVVACQWNGGALALLCGLLLSGCGGGGDPFERHDVSGTVKIDGEPVAFGEIFFKGQVDDKDQTPQTFLPIRGGSFSSSDGAPPGVGENDVAITVYESDPHAADAGGAEAKVIGHWSGKTTVGDGEPLVFDLKAADLSKAN